MRLSGILAAAAVLGALLAPPLPAQIIVPPVVRTLTVQEVATVPPARARFTICRQDQVEPPEPPICLTIVVTPRAGQELAERLALWGSGVTEPDGIVFTYTN